jgi:DNA-binding FadR family transcriptional regulator
MSVLVDLYDESKEEMPAWLQAARLAAEEAAAAAAAAEASEEEEAPPQKVCEKVSALQWWKRWSSMSVSRVWGVQKARGGGGRGRVG